MIVKCTPGKGEWIIRLEGSYPKAETSKMFIGLAEEIYYSPRGVILDLSAVKKIEEWLAQGIDRLARIMNVRSSPLRVVATKGQVARLEAAERPPRVTGYFSTVRKAQEDARQKSSEGRRAAGEKAMGGERPAAAEAGTARRRKS